MHDRDYWEPQKNVNIFLVLLLSELCPKERTTHVSACIYALRPIVWLPGGDFKPAPAGSSHSTFQGFGPGLPAEALNLIFFFAFQIGLAAVCLIPFPTPSGVLRLSPSQHVQATRAQVVLE